MHFVNNTAGTAGDALYGGYVDICIWTKHWSPSYDDVYQPHQLAGFTDTFTNFKYVDDPLNSPDVHLFLLGIGIFEYFFHIENQPGLSPISSDAIGVSVCVHQTTNQTVTKQVKSFQFTVESISMWQLLLLDKEMA